MGIRDMFVIGHLVEKALAFDNIFVFLLVFTSFAVPAAYQKRVLMFGIMGALVLRIVVKCVPTEYLDVHRDIRDRASAEARVRTAMREDVPRDLLPDPQQLSKAPGQFYTHDIHWVNRLLFADSLQPMSSPSHLESLPRTRHVH